MHYFSCSGGPSAVSIKIASGHITPNLCFCIRWYLRVTYSILVRPGHETSMHYFLYSGGISKGSAKSGLGHITLNLSFCIQWDLWVM
jgi:hypothetical protein